MNRLFLFAIKKLISFLKAVFFHFRRIPFKTLSLRLLYLPIDILVFILGAFLILMLSSWQVLLNLVFLIVSLFLDTLMLSSAILLLNHWKPGEVITVLSVLFFGTREMREMYLFMDRDQAFLEAVQLALFLIVAFKISKKLKELI